MAPHRTCSTIDMSIHRLPPAARSVQPSTPTLDSLPPQRPAAKAASDAAGPPQRQHRTPGAATTTMRPRQPLAERTEASPSDSPLLNLPKDLLLAVLDRVTNVDAKDPAASAEQLAQSRFSEASRETRSLVNEWLKEKPDVHKAVKDGPAKKQEAARRAAYPGFTAHLANLDLGQAARPALDLDALLPPLQPGRALQAVRALSHSFAALDPRLSAAPAVAEPTNLTRLADLNLDLGDTMLQPLRALEARPRFATRPARLQAAPAGAVAETNLTRLAAPSRSSPRIDQAGP